MRFKSKRMSQFEIFISIPFLLLLFAENTSARVIDFAKEAITSPVIGPEDPYRKLILSIQENDVLIMSDGSRYTIVKRIGMGNEHCIFTIREADHLVLRIPYRSEVRSSTLDTIDGYQGFAGSDLRVVRVHPRSNWEYVLAERLNPNHFSILDLVLGVDLGSQSPLKVFRPDPVDPMVNDHIQKTVSKARKIAKRELQAMEKSLVEFARHVGGFVQIQDLKENQIFYDRDAKEWILIDWLHSVIRLTPDSHRKNRHDSQFIDFTPRMLNISQTLLEHAPGFRPAPEARERFQRLQSQMTKAIQSTRLKLIGWPRCQNVFE